MQTSFKKNIKGSHTISGTRPSLHNGQLLCSTGVPSLDAVVGGGIAVGSVFMLIEDTNRQYSSLLTRYFLAEGVISDHGILLSESDPKTKFMDHLPQPITLQEDPNAVPTDNMEIAWRYQNSPRVQSTIGYSSKYGNYYDISKTMDVKLLEKSKVVHISLENAAKDEHLGFDAYEHVLKKIDDHIKENKFNIKAAVDSKTHLGILRLTIPNFSSPFWGCSVKKEQRIHAILRFLYCLRAIARQSLVVCWLTVPGHLHSASNLQLMKHNVDYVTELESFPDSKTNSLYKEYHGLVKIHKLPVLNSLLPYSPDAHDLAFKLRRKKFTIERLHLPPDIAETAKRQGVEEQDFGSQTMCGSSGKKSSIDF